MVLTLENVESVFVDVSNNACITNMYIHYNTRSYWDRLLHPYSKNKHQNWRDTQGGDIKLQNVDHLHEY